VFAIARKRMSFVIATPTNPGLFRAWQLQRRPFNGFGFEIVKKVTFHFKSVTFSNEKKGYIYFISPRVVFFVFIKKVVTFLKIPSETCSDS
jgi:hypothetical protein